MDSVVRVYIFGVCQILYTEVKSCISILSASWRAVFGIPVQTMKQWIGNSSRIASLMVYLIVYSVGYHLEWPTVSHQNDI